MKSMLAAMAIIVTAAPAFADEYVNGYTRSDGTYVQGHFRSSADGVRDNNYSYQGNTNPYTGKVGQQKSYDSFGTDCSYSLSC